ncbi:MAG TPA: thioredoxin domain-containing protein, partial [Conexibacter sp.]|nr:thioredoxin domain-containing protein [Conexibacter sp.]
GQSAVANGLLRLSRLTGEAEYERRAEGVIALLHPLAATHPQAFAHLLRAIDFQQSEVHEVAIVGPAESAAPLLCAVRGAFRPHVVLAGAIEGSEDGATVELLEGRHAIDGRAAAYVCERFTCRAPVTDPDALLRLLD